MRTKDSLLNWFAIVPPLMDTVFLGQSLSASNNQCTDSVTTPPTSKRRAVTSCIGYSRRRNQNLTTSSDSHGSVSLIAECANLTQKNCEQPASQSLKTAADRVPVFHKPRATCVAIDLNFRKFKTSNVQHQLFASKSLLV